MKHDGTKNIVIAWICVFIVLAGSMFLFIKLYGRQMYRESERSTLLYRNSRWEDAGNNICKFQIHGEPVDSGSNYVKIKLKCKNGESINTLSTLSLSDLTLEKVLIRLSNVNLFDSSVILNGEDGWKCYVSGRNIDRNALLQNTNLVECYEE